MYNDNNSSPTLTNCILWGDSVLNDPEIYNLDYSNPKVTYSDVQEGYSGTGNIDSIPLFDSTLNGRFQLESDSPCIDAANSDVVLDLDKDSSQRYDDTSVTDTSVGDPTYVDMGVYQYQGD